MSEIDRVLIRAFQKNLSTVSTCTPPAPLQAEPTEPPGVLTVSGSSMVFPGTITRDCTTECIAAVDAAHADETSAAYQVQPPSKPPDEGVSSVRHAVGRPTVQPVWEVDRFSWPSVVKDLSQSVAESVERLVRLIQTAPEQCHVVGLTSYRRGEGRTTAACVVARQAGLLGLRVALVDADRENPSLSESLGIHAPRGWHASLDHVGSVAIDSIEDQVTIVPFSAEGGNGNWQPARLIDELQHDFDLVVIDAPTVMELEGDAWHPTLAPTLRWIVVHDARVTDDADVLNAQKKLRAEGLAMLGVARNFAA